MDEFIFKQRMQMAAKRALEAEERHKREMSEIRAELLRGVRLSLADAREHRVWAGEWREKMRELTDAQALTARELKAFIESRQRLANGSS
jgi:hypothetical protein